MDEDESTDVVQPLPWRFGIEVLRFAGLTTYLWGNWRVTWYDPRDRQNWRLDCQFDTDLWEIGIGPVVLTWVRTE